MALGETDAGVRYEPLTLERAERRFWRQVWDSVPAAVAAEHGIEWADFGPVQATIVADLLDVQRLNLVLGATEPGAVAAGHLAAAVEWAAARGVSPTVPVTPGLPDSDGAEAWLAENGFARDDARRKFVRDAHPPRFKAPAGIEVIELADPDSEPFGMIAAAGLELPAWASTFFAALPGRDGWRCYVARLDGEAQACGAMSIDDGVAELCIDATLEADRRHEGRLALLHRRILDAAAAGCDSLFVETGERATGSSRDFLRAGFQEAYRSQAWRRPPI